MTGGLRLGGHDLAVLFLVVVLVMWTPAAGAVDDISGTIVVDGQSFELRYGKAIEHRALPFEVAEGTPVRVIRVLLINRPPTPGESLSGAPSGVRGVQLTIDPSTHRLTYGTILAPGLLDPLGESSPIKIAFEEQNGQIRGSAVTTDTLRPGSGLEVEFDVTFAMKFAAAPVLRHDFEGDAARASEPARVLVKFFQAAWRSDMKELDDLVTANFWNRGPLHPRNLQELRERLFPSGVDPSRLERSITQVYQYDDVAFTIFGPLPDKWGREGWSSQTLSREGNRWKVGPPAAQQ